MRNTIGEKDTKINELTTNVAELQIIIEAGTSIPPENIKPTQTSTPTFTPTQTFVPVLTPTPTPSFIEDFSGDELDNSKWDIESVDCTRKGNFEVAVLPGNQRVLRFKLEKSEDFPNIICYIPLRENMFNSYGGLKIEFEVVLEDGFTDGSFAGLFTSCGDSELYFFLSPTYVSYRLEEEATENKITYHNPDFPINRILSIEWTSEKILLSIYDEDNVLMDKKSIDCEGLPEYIRFDVSTVEWSSIEAYFDNIKIWNTTIEEGE